MKPENETARGISYDEWARTVAMLTGALREAAEAARLLRLPVADEIDEIRSEASRYARGIPNA